MTFLLIVTATSMAMAALMSAIAWRTAGDERRRREARIAALSAEIHHGLPPRVDEPAVNLFAGAEARTGARRLLVVGGGALTVVAAIAIATVVGRGLTHADRTVKPASAALPAPIELPLELVALGTERVGDQLTVRGVIRNPSPVAATDRLTAVVSLFTSDGGFLASGRAAVDTTAVQPGGESTFVVTVPRAGEVTRYRVSFRSGERLVLHLDRRHES